MAFFLSPARRRRDKAAHALYESVIVQSRQPDFYVRLGVPDTLDGRFDLILLHACLVMRRLKAVAGPRKEEGAALAQALYDLMFADMDQNLRELGVSDMSVGKRIREMVWAFYGRASAYEDGLAGQGLEEAVTRNLYGSLEGEPPAGAPAAMAGYIRTLDQALAAIADGPLFDGAVSFPKLEAAP